MQANSSCRLNAGIVGSILVPGLRLVMRHCNAVKAVTSSLLDVAAMWWTDRSKGNRSCHTTSSHATSDSREPWLDTTRNRVRTAVFLTSGLSSDIMPCSSMLLMGQNHLFQGIIFLQIWHGVHGSQGQLISDKYILSP